MMFSAVLEFIKNHWKTVSAIALGLIIFLFGYYRGYQHEKAVLDALKVDLQAQEQIAKAENTRKVNEAKQITENVTKGYSNAINQLNAYYASHPNIKWVQSCSSPTSSLPPVSDATSETNAKSESNPVSAEGITPLDCASDVLQLLELQDWIKQQQKVK